jgi:hypothetical protein
VPHSRLLVLLYTTPSPPPPSQSSGQVRAELQAAVLAQAQVVCTTCAGAGSDSLEVGEQRGAGEGGRGGREGGGRMGGM